MSGKHSSGPRVSDTQIALTPEQQADAYIAAGASYQCAQHNYASEVLPCGQCARDRSKETTGAS